MVESVESSHQVGESTTTESTNGNGPSSASSAGPSAGPSSPASPAGDAGPTEGQRVVEVAKKTLRARIKSPSLAPGCTEVVTTSAMAAQLHRTDLDAVSTDDHDHHLIFTPTISFSMGPGTRNGSFSLDMPDSPSSTTLPTFNIDKLPLHVERWAALQRITHEEAPSFNFVLQSEENPVKRMFGILVFLLTQGSGKDKVFKLAQNVAALTKYHSTAAESILFYGSAEDNLSKSRKALRTFKIFSEINKIICNTEPNIMTRRLMKAGHLYSICYFLLDHLVGLIEVKLYRAPAQTIAKVRWWKNVFSLLRLLTAFVVDFIFYRMGLVKEAQLRKDLEESPEGAEKEEMRAELHAVKLHRGTLRRSGFGNAINLTLLLSSLNVPVFRDLTMNYIALGGIVTAVLGIYKV